MFKSNRFLYVRYADMSFNRNFYKGATTEDLKKAIAYHNFLISNEEVEALKQKKIDEMFEMYTLNQTNTNTEDVIATIKTNLIINGGSTLQLSP